VVVGGAALILRDEFALHRWDTISGDDVSVQFRSVQSLSVHTVLALVGPM
jgi:hypothetical protein